MSIQAIQTYYDGIKFRSRAEARWAVFFNTLGIQYHYEPEGYSLPSGPYLPDFFLPAHDCFVEIKGAEPTPEEMKKAGELCAMTQKNVFTFFGPIEVPNFGESAYADLAMKRDDGHFFTGWDTGYHWCECPTCGRLDIQFNGRADRIGCRCEKPTGKALTQNAPRLRDAYNAARAERFGT